MRKVKEPYVWDGVTRQTKNKIEPRLKPLISENQKRYTYLKASPYEWQEILNNLDVFAPKQWLSEKVICRSLMDLWWPLRYRAQTGLAYLPFAVLQDISTMICQRGQHGLSDRTSFTGGPFEGQYSSVLPCLERRRVGFILIRNLRSMLKTGSRWTDALTDPNHFFAVVFDYDSQSAYSFGAFCGDKTEVRQSDATSSCWGKWYGPELWPNLAFLLGWESALGPPDEVRVISKEWKQVTSLPLQTDRPILNMMTRMATIAVYILSG
jgi:hypothetical protein